VTAASIYKIVVPDRFVLALSRSACAPSVHRPPGATSGYAS